MRRADVRGRRPYWVCKCDCGRQVTRRNSSLYVYGREVIRSCGCARRLSPVGWANVGGKTKHGASRRTSANYREYTTWLGIKGRCLNPGRSEYSNYGGRGIRICNRWLVFENFLADMGPRPVGTSIDRIDVNGNYEPGNCRWATPLEQKHNQRLSAVRVAAILDRMKAASTDLLELAVLERVRRELLG